MGVSEVTVTGLDCLLWLLPLFPRGRGGEVKGRLLADWGPEAAPTRDLIQILELLARDRLGMPNSPPRCSHAEST